MIPDPSKQAFSLFDEFKAFALKGNVIDMAVGTIIGGAFGKIVDGMVKFIIMPFVAAISGTAGKAGPDGKIPTFADSWVATVNGAPIPYGSFLSEVINFLILAAVLFIFIVKILGWIMKSKKAEAAAPAAPPPPPADVVLLTEIRDLLKNR